MLDQNTHVEMLMNHEQVGADFPSKWIFEGANAWGRACDFMKAIDDEFGIPADLIEHGQDGPCTVSIMKDDANESLDEIAQKGNGRVQPRTR